MSSHLTPGSNGNPSNSSSFVHRRDARSANGVGPTSYVGVGRGYPGSFDFEVMITSLRELFEHDRQIASQSDSARCGTCYLYFSLSELQYRDEGFYVCKECERQIGKQRIQMLRKQQK